MHGEQPNEDTRSGLIPYMFSAELYYHITCLESAELDTLYLVDRFAWPKVSVQNNEHSHANFIVSV